MYELVLSGNSALLKQEIEKNLGVLDFSKERYDENNILIETCILNKIDCIKVLLEKKKECKLDVNAKGQGGRTALHEAKCKEAVRLLIEHNALLQYDDKLMTPFHTLTRLKNYKGMKYLLKHRKYNRNMLTKPLNEEKLTPLHIACKVGEHRILEVLLNYVHIEDLQFEDVHGQTPLYIAVIEDHYECVKLLCERGALSLHPDLINTTKQYLNELRNLPCKPQIKQVLRDYSVLLDYQSNLFQQFKNENTALKIESFDPKQVITETHIGAGATAEVYKCSHKGFSCAMKISKSNDPEIIKIMKNEIDLLLRIPPHPNLVTCLGAEEKPDKKYALYMNYYKGSLHAFLHSLTHTLPSETIFAIFFDIITGLSFLHSLGIAHRDLKPKNCLLDWSESKVPNQGKLKSFVLNDFISFFQ